MSENVHPQKLDIDNIKKIFDKKTSFFLIIIGVGGILIRLYFLPYNLPLTHDALTFTRYSIDILIFGGFPTSGYGFPNNMWPTILSFFFSLFHSDAFFDYMVLQKVLTVVLSVLTIIPVYLLCTRFFKKSLSLIGSFLFVFDPRMIEQSLLGLSDTLFILIGTLALFLFLSNNKKVVYVSFAIASFFTLVRYEGILIIIPFSILFFVRFRYDKKIVYKYLIVLSIFFIILIPMQYVRYTTMGYDGVFSHLAIQAQYVSTDLEKNEGRDTGIFFHPMIALFDLIKYLGWITIPFFIFFISYGIFKVLKNKDHTKITLILFTVFMLIPAYYAYLREFQEVRYLYIILPVFSVLALFTFEKIKNFPLIYIIIPSIIIVVSFSFFSFTNIDYEHELEAYQIAKKLVKNTKGINAYLPETKYIRPAEIEEKWPNIEVVKKRYTNNDIPLYEIRVFDPTNANSLEDFIKKYKNDGLSHIIVDDKENRLPFLKDIFYNDTNYQYLEKIYDSTFDDKFQYRVKVYKINYEKFEL